MMKALGLALCVAAVLPDLAVAGQGHGSHGTTRHTRLSKCMHKCQNYNNCQRSLDAVACETSCAAQCKCLEQRHMLNAHHKDCLAMFQKEFQAVQGHRRHTTGLLQTGKKAEAPHFSEYIAVEEAFGPEQKEVKPRAGRPAMLNQRHGQKVSFASEELRAVWRHRRSARRHLKRGLLQTAKIMAKKDAPAKKETKAAPAKVKTEAAPAKVKAESKAAPAKVKAESKAAPAKVKAAAPAKAKTATKTEAAPAKAKTEAQKVAPKAETKKQ